MAEEAASVPANPAPLGLAGFGLTTVVLSSINAGRNAYHHQNSHAPSL